MTDGGAHLLHRKTPAIIAHFQQGAVFCEPNAHFDVFGTGVLGRIAQGFLADVEQTSALTRSARAPIPVPS
jgi:hypothetical protein